MNKHQNKKILIFLLLTLMNIVSPNIILKFKTLKPENLTNENLMEKLYQNKIYFEIKIGTPEQTIPMFIKMREYSSFITSHNFNGSIIKFNYLNSTSFNYIEDVIFKYYKYDFTKAILASENINFGNNKKCENLTIIIANDLRKSSAYLSGIIGLKLTPNEKNLAEKYNLISLLKEKKLINDYSFSLKYNNENEGEFIIGSYLDNIKIENNENIENYIKTSYIGVDDISIQWNIGLDVYLNGNLIDKKILSSLAYEYNFFEGSENYKNEILKNYFNIYFTSGKCKEISFKLLYTYFVCDDDISFEKFPSLNFYHKNLNYTFSFNYKDLFYHFQNKYFFMIIFHDPPSITWSLGKIFFQKYHISFDREKKLFGVYTINYNNIPISYSLIIIIILSLALFIIIIYIKFCIVIQKRKTRANELQDDYDYLPQENYKNNKLFVSRNKNINGIDTILI